MPNEFKFQFRAVDQKCENSYDERLRVFQLHAGGDSIDVGFYSLEEAEYTPRGEALENEIQRDANKVLKAAVFDNFEPLVGEYFANVSPDVIALAAYRAVLKHLVAQLMPHQVAIHYKAFPGLVNKLTLAQLKRAIDLCQRTIHDNQKHSVPK